MPWQPPGITNLVAQMGRARVIHLTSEKTDRVRTVQRATGLAAARLWSDAPLMTVKASGHA